MRIKNIIIYFLIVIIIFLSLRMPNILMERLSKNIEKRLYKIVENESQIDVEAEKIYLVKAIHSIKSDNPLVTISSDAEKTRVYESYEYSSDSNTKNPNIDKEINSLKEYQILDNIDSSGNYGIGIINKTYLNKYKYIVHNVLVNIGETELHFEIENKTGKVIYAYFDKENLYNDNFEDILKNFVKYLDFHIIKDWKYEEDLINKKYSLNSESAKLSINLDASSDKCELAVRVSNF